MGDPAGNRIALYQYASGGPSLQIAEEPPYRINLIARGYNYYAQTLAEEDSPMRYCRSDRVAVPIKFLRVPATPVTSDVSRCNAGPVMIRAHMGNPSGTAMALYTSSPTSPIRVLTGDPYVFHVPQVDATTYFYLASLIPGCTSQYKFVRVTVEFSPQISFRNETRCCLNEPFRLLSAFPGGGTFYGPGLEPNGRFTPMEAGVGRHVFTYRVTTGGGCVWSAQSEIEVLNCREAVEAKPEDLALQSGPPLLQIYPNPARNHVTLSLTTEKETEKESTARVTLRTLEGKLLRQHPWQITEDPALSLSLEGLTAGMYLLEITLNRWTYHEKLIVE